MNRQGEAGDAMTGTPTPRQRERRARLALAQAVDFLRHSEWVDGCRFGKGFSRHEDVVLQARRAFATALQAYARAIRARAKE